jgi:hypothetical protein
MLLAAFKDVRIRHVGSCQVGSLRPVLWNLNYFLTVPVPVPIFVKLRLRFRLLTSSGSGSAQTQICERRVKLYKVKKTSSNLKSRTPFLDDTVSTKQNDWC